MCCLGFGREEEEVVVVGRREVVVVVVRGGGEEEELSFWGLSFWECLGLRCVGMECWDCEEGHEKGVEGHWKRVGGGERRWGRIGKTPTPPSRDPSRLQKGNLFTGNLQASLEG